MISKDLGEGMGGVTMATDLGIGPQNTSQISHVEFDFQAQA